jgi:regulatory protein
MRSLARQPKTILELRDRLLRNYDGASVESVIQQLIRQRILDDKAFANAWCYSRQQSHPRSAALISYELLAKGVDNTTILDAVAGIDDDKEAKHAIIRYVKKISTLDQSHREGRITSYLQRRGFNPEVIHKTLAWVSECG